MHGAYSERSNVMSDYTQGSVFGLLLFITCKNKWPTRSCPEQVPSLLTTPSYIDPIAILDSKHWCETQSNALQKSR